MILAVDHTAHRIALIRVVVSRNSSGVIVGSAITTHTTDAEGLARLINWPRLSA